MIPQLPKGRVKLLKRPARPYHLTHSERLKIYLHVTAGRSVDEIALLFNTTPKSVRRVVHRLSQGQYQFVKRFKSEVGNIYGLLTVISFSHRDRGAWFNCQCFCGRSVKIRGYQLRQGKTVSCGCVRKCPKYKFNNLREVNS